MSHVYSTTFDHTRRAIEQMDDPSLKRDFTEMLIGVEYGLAQENPELAVMCWNTVLAMAIGLHGTITSEVSFAIVSGLLEDSQQDSIFDQARAPIDTSKNSACSFDVSGCIDSPASTCRTIRGQPGCSSPKLMVFPWQVKS